MTDQGGLVTPGLAGQRTTGQGGLHILVQEGHATRVQGGHAILVLAVARTAQEFAASLAGPNYGGLVSLNIIEVNCFEG